MAIGCHVIGVMGVMAWTLLLGGCSILPEPALPPAEYRLTGAAEAFRAAADGPVLVVGMPAAAGGYTGTAMRYREHGQRLSRYASGQWVEPPAAMLANAAIGALGGTGRFRAVVSDEDAVAGDLRLSLYLRRLVHDLSAGDGGVVRLEVRMTLLDHAGRVIAADVLTGSARSESAGPAGMAAAGGEALDAVLTRLVERVNASHAPE